MGTGMDAGKAKGRKLLADAREVGWDLKEFREVEEDERFELDLWNEETTETICVAWEDGVWQHPAVYEHDGRKINLRNASHARKRMAMPPDLVLQRRPGRNSEERTARIIARRVPFDPEDTNEAELRECLGGKKLVWINTISGLPEEAVVPGGNPNPVKGKPTPPGGKQFQIVNGEAGRPILRFVDPYTTGYRAVALEAILQVG